jgi:hypothetical protein
MDLSNHIFDCIRGTSSTTLHVAILILDILYNQNLDNLLKYLGSSLLKLVYKTWKIRRKLNELFAFSYYKATNRFKLIVFYFIMPMSQIIEWK